MKLRVLNAEQVRAVLPMPVVIEAMRSAFRQLHAGDVEMPVRRQLSTGKGVSLFMQAHLPRQRTLGEKVVSVNAENRAAGLPAIHALVTLYDPSSGAPSALLEGASITALRTGAVTGLAVDLLASREARVLTVFGAGVQAPAQIAAVLAVREIESVRILSRSDSAARLVEELGSADPDRHYEVPDDPEEAVRTADVVVTVTTSRGPVFDGGWVHDGCLVAAVGAFRPETREVDSELIRRSAVVVDQKEAAQKEAGDLIIPAEAGEWAWDDLYAELGAIAAGAREAPRTGGRPIFFKSCGLAVEDVAAAQVAVERAERQGIGSFVEL